MSFLKSITLALIFIVGLFSVAIVQSQTIYVSQKLGNDANNGSKNSPLKTIASAIATVKQKDTILVDPGTYAESLDFQNKIFILKSSKGADSTILTSTVGNVILVGSTIGTPEDSLSYLREIYGFTISTQAANAIYTNGGTRLKITNCIFKNNSGGYGAIHNNAVTTFQNTLFIDNTWALCLQGRDTTSYPGGEVFINCVFTGNGAMNTCLIEGNWKPKFINCIITKNNGGKTSLGPGYEVYNSIIDDVLYSLQSSNYNIDPQFVNEAAKNFRLKSSSPALGLGVSRITISGIEYLAPKFDLADSVRPNPIGSNPDLGVFEDPKKGAPLEFLAAEGGNKSVLLRWSKPFGVNLVKYKILRSTTPIIASSLNNLLTDTVSINKTEFLDTFNVVNLTRYYYRIIAIDNAGVEGEFSNELSVKPNIPPPGVTNFKAEGGPNSIFLSWDRVNIAGGS